MCTQSLSSVRLCDPMDFLLAHQAPPSMGFSRQEYWSRWPFPPPGDLPDPGTEPVSPVLTGRFFTTEPPGKPYSHPSPHQRQGFVMVEQNEHECVCKCVTRTPTEISCIRYLFLWPLWPTSRPWLSVQFEKSESRGSLALVWGQINTITVPWSS